MITAQTTLSLFLDGHGNWEADWIWGCPLILLTVFIHVLGLGYLSQKSILLCGYERSRHYPRIAFAIVVGAMTLLATILHAIETGIWALAYCFIGTMPNLRNSMLYSLGAMTTYGHDNLVLEDRWRLLGTIEALSGWLLFGLSTAFLFWLIQEVSPNNRARR
jgi:hypothetical protein